MNRRSENHVVSRADAIGDNSVSLVARGYYFPAIIKTTPMASAPNMIPACKLRTTFKPTSCVERRSAGDATSKKRDRRPRAKSERDESTDKVTNVHRANLTVDVSRR